MQEYMDFDLINKYLGSGKNRYDVLQGGNCDPFAMYQDIFNNGIDLQDKNELFTSNKKYNLICVRIPKNKDPKKTKNILITKGLNELKKIIDSNDKYFNILSCISYAGRRKTKLNARYMYALVIDLDNIIANKKNIIDYGLYNLDFYIERQKKIKLPNYIVASGHGLHLYYIFKEPIPMYKENIELIRALKKSIVDTIWNDDISTVSKQYGDIVQGFRVGGTYTKNYNDKTQCYHFTNERYTMYDIIPNSNISEKDKQAIFNLTNHIDTDRPHYKLEELKTKYPKWYEDRIIKKIPPKDKTKCNKWNINTALYKWWLGKIKDIKVGHRYWYCFFIMVYGIKCNIEKETILKDIDNARKKLTTKDNPFTQKDINDILRNYNENQFLWKRKTIEENVGIPIPPNKRNGLPQKIHLQNARNTLKYKIESNIVKVGRKTKHNVNDIYTYILMESDKSKEIANHFNISVRQARRYKKYVNENIIKK